MQAAKLVFYFDDPLEFLNTFFQEKQKTNPRFSLREWARQIGYENPSMLFQVLKGERKLKLDLALKIAANLGLSGKALRYFELLVLRRASQSPTERYVFETMLATLRPPKLREINKLSLDIYTATADWYHWAIYTMAGLKDFLPDAAWIQKRLGSEIDKKTIKNALERLVRLGFLKEKPDGLFQQVSIKENPLIQESGLPPEAIRQYHSQMIEKAKFAIEVQSSDETQVKGTTLAFSKNDLVQASKILSEAHRQIAALAARSQGDEVYQLNSQLFRITNTKRRKSGSIEADLSGDLTASPTTQNATIQ